MKDSRCSITTVMLYCDVDMMEGIENWNEIISVTKESTLLKGLEKHRMALVFNVFTINYATDVVCFCILFLM